MEQPQVPQVPTIVVSAPILLRMLTIVKHAHIQDDSVSMEMLINTEITQLSEKIADEVLTPKWKREVDKEVEKFFAKAKALPEGEECTT